MAKKIAEVNEKIVQDVVKGCKAIENGAVKGFNKVVDKCVDVLFIKEGEIVAKARLSKQ